jgi:hypothetical protein
LAETENDLLRKFYHLNKTLKEYNMKISGEKTKVVATLRRGIIGTKIIIDNEKIEQVSKFKYLGCNISVYGINEDLEENVQKYSKLNGCIRKHFGKNMRQDLQLRLHKIISKPTLKYGSETWVLRAKKQKTTGSIINAFPQVNFCVTLRDKAKSEAIRTQLRENIEAGIRGYQEKLRKHVMRMTMNRFLQCALTYKPLAKQDLGRPRI